MLGFSEEARLLIVCHCERNQGTLSELFQLEKPPKLRAKNYQGIKPCKLNMTYQQ